MAKDFDTWNEDKKRVDAGDGPKYWYARELWWCALGVNVGFEQDGSGKDFYRPVLILKGLSAQTCLIIPLTKSTHTHPLRPSLGLVNGHEAHALLSQMRVIDIKRLVRKIGSLDQKRFEDIRKAVRAML